MRNRRKAKKRVTLDWGYKTLEDAQRLEFRDTGIRDPVIIAALRYAREKFLAQANVVSIGVGRKFRERESKFAPLRNKRQPFCIKVYVKKKKPRSKLGPRTLLPKFIEVKVPYGSRRGRVPIDVVAVRTPRAQRSTGQFQGSEQDRWPTDDPANTVAAGRLITFGFRRAVSQPTGNFSDGEATLGTIGAVIETRNGTLAAITAGHVFAIFCGGQFETPQDFRGLGAQGRKWWNLGMNAILPSTLRFGQGQLFDTAIFRIPQPIRPPLGNYWPEGFRGRMATTDDYAVALQRRPPNAALWIERNGRSEMLTCVLEGVVSPFGAKTCGNSGPQYLYPRVVQTRFLGTAPASIKGDSGAGLYITSADGNERRLLAFHHMFANGLAFAMLASDFFRNVIILEPGSDFRFQPPGSE
jgi:hypothetical protein